MAAPRDLPTVFLRLEGAVLLGLAVFLYTRGDQGWLLFVLLILVPDISILVYAAGPRVERSPTTCSTPTSARPR